MKSTHSSTAVVNSLGNSMTYESIVSADISSLLFYFQLSMTYVVGDDLCVDEVRYHSPGLDAISLRSVKVYPSLQQGCSPHAGQRTRAVAVGKAAQYLMRKR